jgi:hypothetical protein
MAKSSLLGNAVDTAPLGLTLFSELSFPEMTKGESKPNGKRGRPNNVRSRAIKNPAVAGLVGGEQGLVCDHVQVNTHFLQSLANF